MTDEQEELIIQELTKVLSNMNQRIVVLYNAKNKQEETTMKRIYGAVLCHKMWISPIVLGGEAFCSFKDGSRIDLREADFSKKESGDLFFIKAGSAARTIIDEGAEVWEI